jgi:sulfonate transport system substrate-binding protein
MGDAYLKRRAFGAMAAMAAASAAVPALRAQPKLEKPRVKIAMGEKAALPYLPLTVAAQLGYFKDEGLDVMFGDVADSAPSVKTMVAGVGDVGCGAFEHTAMLRSGKGPYCAFVVLARAPQIALGISTRTLARYRDVSDLAGRRIGVVALPGSSARTMAKLVLARGGVGLADVSWVRLEAASAAAALQAGHVDAISGTEPIMTMLEQRGEVRAICDTRTQQGTQALLGGAMPGTCLYASWEFLQKHPRTAQALANAAVRALKWLQTASPGDLINCVPGGYLLGGRAAYIASFNKVREAISLDGTMPDGGPEAAMRTLAAVEPAIDIEGLDMQRLFTERFARVAKERFKA